MKLSRDCETTARFETTTDSSSSSSPSLSSPLSISITFESERTSCDWDRDWDWDEPPSVLPSPLNAAALDEVDADAPARAFVGAEKDAYLVAGTVMICTSSSEEECILSLRREGGLNATQPEACTPPL